MRLEFKTFRFSFFFLLSFLAMSSNANNSTPERVLWDKKPIPLHIQHGHERIIHFPDEIRYWLPDSLQQRITALAANGVLYLQAHAEFPPTRIRVQGLTTQQIYLLDVFADDSPSVSDELIIMEAGQVINQAAELKISAVEEDWTVRLTRYAAQQLYAPERLLKGDVSIKRINVDTVPTSLLRGANINTTPIGAWKGGGLFITAVKLVNQSSERIDIVFNKPEKPNALNLATQLRGRWLTVTPQHLYVDEQGSDADTTVLYLISGQPFVESIDSIGDR